MTRVEKKIAGRFVFWGVIFSPTASFFSLDQQRFPNVKIGNMYTIKNFLGNGA